MTYSRPKNELKRTAEDTATYSRPKNEPKRTAEGTATYSRPKNDETSGSWTTSIPKGHKLDNSDVQPSQRRKSTEPTNIQQELMSYINLQPNLQLDYILIRNLNDTIQSTRYSNDYLMSTVSHETYDKYTVWITILRCGYT